jgi:hypothetical protein
MACLRKPDALSGAERQRRHVEAHRLVTSRVRPETKAALQEARARRKRSVDKVLWAALAELARKEVKPPRSMSQIRVVL